MALDGPAETGFETVGAVRTGDYVKGAGADIVAGVVGYLDCLRGSEEGEEGEGAAELHFG